MVCITKLYSIINRTNVLSILSLDILVYASLYLEKLTKICSYVTSEYYDSLNLPCQRKGRRTKCIKGKWVRILFTIFIFICVFSFLLLYLCLSNCISFSFVFFGFIYVLTYSYPYVPTYSYYSLSHSFPLPLSLT